MEKSARTDEAVPILAYSREIADAIRANQVVIVAGETGCGKTSRLPLMCFEALRKNGVKIAVTQPRRIAAVSLSRYVNSLATMQIPAPSVGYKIRFSATATPSTDIVFMTDGILLAQIAAEPLLARYGVIIIDEAHERTLTIDFLLGYLRTVLPRRPDLRLIIASATLDTKLFSRSFYNAPVITVGGRAYPIDIRYEPVIGLWKGRALRSYVDGVVHAVQRIVGEGESGDILAFLPTVEDILECQTVLRALMQETDCTVLTLFGRMDPESHEAIFSYSARRRIILATNIAETSITVPNIRFVIDTGVARLIRFDPGAGINRMPIEAISQASAGQRAGRCGRVANGICIRLYSQADFASRPRYTLPEIRRANLAGALLRMAALGVGSPDRFPFLQHPSPAAVAAGYRQLRFLEAIDFRGRLTDLGRAMARLPLDPAISRMLLHARETNAFSEAAVIAAALSVGELWSGQAVFTAFKSESAKNGIVSDFSALVRCWRRLPVDKKGRGSGRRFRAFCDQYGLSAQRVREWLNIHRHLVCLCAPSARSGNHFSASAEAIHKSLLCAFAGGLAYLQDNGNYKTARMHDLAVMPGSLVHGKRKQWVLFHDIVETKRPYGRYAAEISPHWVQQLFPHRCRTTFDNIQFDGASGRVMCLRQVTFNGLALVKDQSEDFGKARPDEANRVFIEEALVNEQDGMDFDFLMHNRALRDSIDLMQRKLRTRSLYRGDRALADWYCNRLPGITSVEQLQRRIGREKNDRFLRVSVSDLLDGPTEDYSVDYPDFLSVAGRNLSVSYLFEPGSQNDGATVTVPLDVFNAVPLYFWEWLLPVFYRERIAAVVRGILATKPETGDDIIDTIVQGLRPGRGGFLSQVRRLTARILGECADDALSFQPMHLWLRVAVVDAGDHCIEAFRPPWTMPYLSPPILGKRPELWRQWCLAWEKHQGWDWGEQSLLQEVFIQPTGQLAPLRGISGFSVEEKKLYSRIFFSEGLAYESHRKAVRELLERVLHEKIAWAWHDCIMRRSVPFQLSERCAALGISGAIEALFAEIVLELDYTLPQDKRQFASLCQTAENRLATAAREAIALLSEILPLYASCAVSMIKMNHSKTLTPATRVLIDELEAQLGFYFDIISKPACRIKNIRSLSRQLRVFTGRVRLAAEKPLRYHEYKGILDEFTVALLTGRKMPEAACPENARMLDDFEEAIGELAVTFFMEGKMPTLFPVSQEIVRKSMCGLQALS